MKEYVIKITEILEKVVFVNADSQEDAHKRVREDYKNGECILNADNFVNVEFELKGEFVW